MKDLISKTRSVQMLNAYVVSDDNYTAGTEVDIGTARRGTLFLSHMGAGSYDNISVYTSDVATILTKGTVGLLANRPNVTQDTVNSVATTTITSSGVWGLSATSGLYVYDLWNLQRYVNIQFDSVTSDTAAARKTLSAILVCTDLEQAPHAAAASSY